MLLTLAGCSDIMEHDVSLAQLSIISPKDGYRTDSYVVTFWWEKYEGAQKYRLQIAQPSFENIQQLVFDSLIGDVKKDVTLFPGKYEWRIRIENGNSRSPYITRSIIVDSNMVLSGQPFSVQYPSENFYSRTGIINFGWQKFPGAGGYEFMVTDTFMMPVKSTVSEHFQISDTFNEGVYVWKVRGVNSINMTTTEYSAPRRLFVDMTPPGQPALQSPLNLSITSNPVSLSWLRNGDAIADSVFIATDTAFLSLVERNLVNSLPSLDLPVLTIGNTYYWRVKSVDKAGNWSQYSPYYQFIVTL